MGDSLKGLYDRAIFNEWDVKLRCETPFKRTLHTCDVFIEASEQF